MIERIEALCARLAPDKWPSVEDLSQAKQLLPLMLDVVMEHGIPTRPLDQTRAEMKLIAHCAEHLPEVRP